MTQYERRIGQRKPFEGFPAVIVPLRRRTSGDDLRPKRGYSETHGHVLDMSLSGANVAAPSKVGLTIGSLVEVRIDEDRTFVGRVRRLAATDDERWVRCGVVHLEMSPGYRNWLDEWTLPRAE